MIRHKKYVEKVGYDKNRKRFLGFKVNGEQAFKNVHPDILLRLDPRPEFGWMQRKDIQYRINEID